jgi:coatomer protein complex subunit gamma
MLKGGPAAVHVQDTVETVMSILGMHPCEGTEAVPPHARSHTVLLSGQFPGDERALVRWVQLLTYI